MDNAGILIEAFDRCEIRQPEITRNQIKSAVRSLNLALQSFSLRGVNLWKVDLQSLTLQQGVVTYAVPGNTVDILDAYIETTNQDGMPTDRVILPISRTDYSMIPNKQQQSPPTVYWFDKLISPMITVWTAPDGNGPYTLNYYRTVQIQDAAATMGQSPEITYLFQDALCAELAARLALKFAKPLYMDLKNEAKEAWMMAAAENHELVDIYIKPNLYGYYNDL